MRRPLSTRGGMTRPLCAALGVVAAVASALGACARDGAADRALGAGTATATTTPAHATDSLRIAAGAAAIDLSRIMTQVHFGFRAEGDALVARHTTFAVSASADGRVAFTPV